MKRGFTIVEMFITVTIMLVFACTLLSMKNAKKEHDAKAKTAESTTQEKPRFESEIVAHIGHYSVLVRDTKTGREWLAIQTCGIVEVTPQVTSPEKEQP